MTSVTAMTAVAATAALLTLAACGGGGTSFSSSSSIPPVTPPVAMVDAFYTAVLNLIGDGAETSTEPVATDAIAATTPEDTEPLAVK